MSLALLTELRTRLIPSEVGGDGSHESTQGLVVAENYGGGGDGSFLCVVKTQIRWSNKIYKTELTKTR